MKKPAAKQNISSLELVSKYSMGLKDAGIKSHYLDSLIMIESALNINRAKLLSNEKLNLSKANINVLNKYYSQRLSFKPISQIVQYSEFYGNHFFINQHVLKPRPESEAFIDMALDLIKGESRKMHKLPLTILDLGTGSGALAISLKIEAPETNIIASDISIRALKVAKFNAVTHTTQIEFIHSDLLNKVPYKPLIIMANLPYIPLKFKVDQSIMFEPKLSLFSGSDGLDLYRRLFKQMSKRSNFPLYLLLEALAISHSKLIKLAIVNNYALVQSKGLLLLFKYVPAE